MTKTNKQSAVKPAVGATGTPEAPPGVALIQPGGTPDSLGAQEADQQNTGVGAGSAESKSAFDQLDQNTLQGVSFQAAAAAARGISDLPQEAGNLADWTSQTRLPGAKLYDVHAHIVHDNELFQPGDRIPLSDKAAGPLLAIQAIAEQDGGEF